MTGQIIQLMKRYL